MAKTDGDEKGQEDLQGKGSDGGVRQRPGPQSGPASVDGPRPRKGQVRRYVVRHRPQHGTQFRSPTATDRHRLYLTSPTTLFADFFTASEVSSVERSCK